MHTTITKAIVGGFEFAVLQRNLKGWHKRPWTCVCACCRKAIKRSFDSYRIRNSVLIIFHITFPDCPVHTFSNNCLEIAVHSSWCFPFCGEWNSLKWNKTWIIWPGCNFSGALLRAKHAQQRTMVNIREILVITWPFVHPPVRPFAPKAYQCKINQSTGMATQMALEVFGAKLRGLPDF